MNNCTVIGLADDDIGNFYKEVLKDHYSEHGSSDFDCGVSLEKIICKKITDVFNQTIECNDPSNPYYEPVIHILDKLTSEAYRHFGVSIDISVDAMICCVSPEIIIVEVLSDVTVD